MRPGRPRRRLHGDFHTCGRATLLLEDIADTGPDAVETLTFNRSSGDVDLADAKRRIGDRVCLFGGFNEHILHEGDADDVRAECGAVSTRPWRAAATCCARPGRSSTRSRA